MSLRFRLFTVLFIVLVGAATVIWYGIRPSYADAIVEERLNLMSEYQQQRIRESDMLLYFWLRSMTELQAEFESNPANIETSFSNYSRLLPDLAGFKIADDTGNERLQINTRPEIPIPDFLRLAELAFVIRGEQELWAGFSDDRRYLFLSQEFRENGERLWITTLFDARRIVDIMTQNVLREDAYTTIWMPDGNTLGRNLPAELQPGRTTRTSFSRTTVDNKDYLTVSASFSSIPLLHSMYIDVSVLEQQVAQLFSQSLIMLIVAFLALGAGGNLLISRVQRPIKNFVEDVAPFSNYEFDRPFRHADLPELAGVTEKMEEIRLKLAHYKRINVEQVIVQEQRNNMLMNYATEMVARYEQNGELTFINEQLSELLRELKLPLHGLTVSDIINHKKVIIRKDNTSDEISKDGLVITGRTIDIQVNISGDTVYYLEMHLSDISDEYKNHFGGLLLLNDVTKSRELEQVRTEMINIIVHELQNPVSAGLGLTSYLIDEEDVDRKEQVEVLSMIQNSLHKLSGMIERFLQISRLESANIRLDMQPVDMNMLVRPVANSFRTEISERNIQIIVNEESTPLVSGAIDLLEDMIRNLLSNAIKYGPDKRTIDVSLWSDSKSVNISVTDHGFGIPEEYQDKIFNKFFRIKDYDTQKGTGLGLAYVKEIVTKHKGTISVESNSDIGTRFTVSLPIHASKIEIDVAS